MDCAADISGASMAEVTAPISSCGISIFWRGAGGGPATGVKESWASSCGMGVKAAMRGRSVLAFRFIGCRVRVF